LKGNVVLYVVGAVLALIVLQVAVSVFFSLLPAILFFLASIVAAICAYAIFTEKDARRIASVDKLLGIAVAIRKPSFGTSTSSPVAVSAKSSTNPTQVAAPVDIRSEQISDAAPVSVNTHEHVPVVLLKDEIMDSEGPLDGIADPVPEPVAGGVPTAPPTVPLPPRPPTSRVDYGGLIDDIKSRPIPRPPSPSRPTGSNAPTDGGGGTTIDYGNLVSKMQSATPVVMSKDELIAAIGKNVIGQRAAIETLATYVRGKIGSRDTGKNKPLVFMLPGPTGTGKTEISKALAEALGTKLVRFDMGEYGEEFKATNLFGAPKGYVGAEDGGALPNAIRRGGGKRLVVLFDEVEKAHQSLWQKMLAFMDEGRTGDSKGEVLAPKDTIILLTTNRQAEEVAKDPAAAREILRHDGYFSPEFMGRVEKVVPMPRGTEVDMMQLTHRLADILAGTYGLSLAMDDDALMMLYSESRDGAERSGGRGITERLKDLLIEDLLELQGEGREIGRLIVMEGKVRAVSA